MRNFNVRVENTDFQIQVEEIKVVPLIPRRPDYRAWAASGHQKLMSLREF